MECLLDDVPIERLPLFEKACIEHFDSYKNGYNSTPGGDGTGKEVTEEFRQKMSKIHKGKTPWNKGVPMPEYIREKLLAAHVGKKHSEETRRKMSEARKGRKPFLLPIRPDKGKSPELLAPGVCLRPPARSR